MRHAWLCLWLSASVALVSVRQYQVHRAAVHGLMQLAFVASAAALQRGSAPEVVVVFGVLPLALLSRVWGGAWHRTVGRAAVASYLCLALYDGWSRGSRVASVALVGVSLWLYVVVMWAYLPRFVPWTTLDVEGSGWGLYLGRFSIGRTVRAPAGRSEGLEGDWWRSGTTVSEVQRALARRGRTMAGHPSLLATTLGGWVFTGAHGSGGTRWTPAFGRVRVYDRHERRMRIVADKKECFGDTYTIAQQRRFVVVDVEVRSVPNVRVWRQARYLVDSSDYRWFLGIDTYVRLIFVTTAGTLAFVWVDAETPPPARTNLVPPWLATVLPSSWRYDPTGWTRATTLREAHVFAPDPPMWATPFMLLYVNFEVFIEARMTPLLLERCCVRLQRLFATGTRGRCEVRCGATKVFLDFAITTRDYPRIFEAIREVFGPVRMTLHKGKAQVPSN